MRDIVERTHFERPRRHYAVMAQQIAQHRKACAKPKEAAVGAAAFVQAIGHGVGQMFDHALAHVRRMDQRSDADSA